MPDTYRTFFNLSVDHLKFLHIGKGRYIGNGIKQMQLKYLQPKLSGTRFQYRLNTFIRFQPSTSACLYQDEFSWQDEGFS